jgi:hypothetical protein
MGPSALGIVTPVPDGSARMGDIEMLPTVTSGSGPNNAFVSRAGHVAGFVTTSSNWALGGEAPTIIEYKGASCYRIRQDAIGFDFRAAVIVTKPLAFRVSRNPLFILEALLAWPTNTVGVENGLVLAFQNNLANNRPISTAQTGFAIYNDGGALTFAMRGAVGLQTTVIATGFALTEWHKIRIEILSATRDADATLRVFVNDSGAASIVKTAADANWPAIGATANSAISVGLGVLSATEYCNWRDIGFWRGPDTPLGM